MRNAQQNFIRAQDYATRRCTHLYEADQDSRGKFLFNLYYKKTIRI